jgi:hypothetical protein
MSKPGPSPFKRIAIHGFPFHGEVLDHTLYKTTGGTRFLGSSYWPNPSNVLLKKIQDLPDRTGNVLDAAEGFDWKDRHLYHPPSKYDFMLIDEANNAYTMDVDVSVAGKIATFNVRLKKRFGLFDVTGSATVNYSNKIIHTFDVDFTSETRHSGLYDYAVRQNPDGRDILIEIDPWNLQSNYHGYLAMICRVQINGTIDPETGTGLSATDSIYKTGDDCIADIVTTETSNTLQKYVHEVLTTETVTCNAGNKEYSSTTQYSSNKRTPTSAELSNQYIQKSIEGELTESTVTDIVIGGFYDEAGVLRYVEESRSIDRVYTSEFDFSLTSANEKTSELRGSDFYYITSKTIISGSGNMKIDDTITSTMDLKISGVTVASGVAEFHTYNYKIWDRYSDTGVVSVDLYAGTAPCVASSQNTTGILYKSFVDQHYSTDQQLGITATNPVGKNLDVDIDGVSVSSGPTTESASPKLFSVRKTNRLFSVLLSTDYDTDHYGAYTNDAEITGLITNVSYDPYTHSIGSSTSQIGYL